MRSCVSNPALAVRSQQPALLDICRLVEFGAELWRRGHPLCPAQTTNDPAAAVDASRLLLGAALGSPHNRQFLLLSEACVPLYPAQVVWQQLVAEDRSRVNACRGVRPEPTALYLWHSSLFLGSVCCCLPYFVMAGVGTRGLWRWRTRTVITPAVGFGSIGPSLLERSSRTWSPGLLRFLQQRRHLAAADALPACVAEAHRPRLLAALHAEHHAAEARSLVRSISCLPTARLASAEPWLKNRLV